MICSVFHKGYFRISFNRCGYGSVEKLLETGELYNAAVPPTVHMEILRDCSQIIGLLQVRGSLANAKGKSLRLRVQLQNEGF